MGSLLDIGYEQQSYRNKVPLSDAQTQEADLVLGVTDPQSLPRAGGGLALRPTRLWVAPQLHLSQARTVRRSGKEWSECATIPTTLRASSRRSSDLAYD